METQSCIQHADISDLSDGLQQFAKLFAHQTNRQVLFRNQRTTYKHLIIILMKWWKVYITDWLAKPIWFIFPLISMKEWWKEKTILAKREIHIFLLVSPVMKPWWASNLFVMKWLCAFSSNHQFFNPFNFTVIWTYKI